MIKLWNGARPDIALLLSGPDNLERYFAEQERSQGVPNAPRGSLLDLGDDEISSDDRDLAEITAQVNAIDEALGRLNKIRRERGEVLKDLKEKVPFHLASWSFARTKKKLTTASNGRRVASPVGEPSRAKFRTDSIRCRAREIPTLSVAAGDGYRSPGDDSG